MPRQPRLHLDEMPLHIVQRGHNHQRCFATRGDRLRYLHCLRTATLEFDCRLHAYVLMTNHVHLLMTPAHAALVPRMIMSIGRHYVQHFNRIHQRSGTLWDGRYKASLVDTDRYLLACYRYIELNPVRAGIVPVPADYNWSSYRANALGEPDPCIVAHPVYLALGEDGSARRRAYLQLFEGHTDDSIDEIRQALIQGQPLGSKRFQNGLAVASGTLRVARPRGRPTKARAIDVVEAGDKAVLSDV